MPTRLFRFLSKAAANFLDAKKLWFSHILDFNDPFDATPSLTQVIDQSCHSFLYEVSGHQRMPEDLRHAIEKEKTQAATISTRFLQEKFGECFGVACFTATNQVVPMWSRYASNHEGFALEFNPEHPFFDGKDFGDVTYSSKRPQVPLTTNQLDETLRRLAFTKSTEWRDEAEWRLVKAWHDLKHGVKPWDNKPGRYLDLPPDAMRAVYFGCRATHELTKLIERSCKSPEYRDVKILQMIPDTADYRLVAVPWDGHKSIIPDAERPVLDMLWRTFSAGYPVPSSPSAGNHQDEHGMEVG